MRPTGGWHRIPAWLLVPALLLVLVLSARVPVLVAQGTAQGQWRTLPYLMPINPVHIALTYTGKVLIVAGSGNDPSVTDFRAAVWDPEANTIVTQPVGGDPFWGEPRNAIFDPATSTFTDVQNMAHGRWYPTVTVLGDGRVMTFSGLKE